MIGTTSLEMPAASLEHENRPSSPWRTALAWWALTRPTLLVVGWLAILLIGYGPEDSVTSWRVYASELANLPARWDSYFYLDIATGGYSWNGSNEEGQNVAFFPAFPLATRAIAALTRIPPLWAGVLVSFAAFLVALSYLYRLARDLLDERHARWTVALLATYPGATFFSAAYTEALFLLACLGAFYHLRQRQLAPAAAWALVAGVTRVQGFLLCVPLGYIAWRDRDALTRSVAARIGAALVVAAPLIGLALFSAYLGRTFGHPLLWLENQAGWGRPAYLDLFRAKYPEPVESGHPITIYDRILDTWNYLAVLFVAGMVPFIVRALGWEYLLFVGICIGPGLIGHPFTSMTRFTAVVFPAFIAAAHALGTERRVRVVAVGFFALQLFGAAMFFTWRHFI